MQSVGSETECAYIAKFIAKLVAKFRTAGHFKQLLMNSVKGSGELVPLFDKSLNNVTQPKPLDVHL